MTPPRTLPSLALTLAACVGAATGATGAHLNEQSAGAPAARCVKAGEKETRATSSVDGRELLWEDDTKYNDAYPWANSKWYQTSGTLSRIRIAPDNATSINDLEWRDWAKNNTTLGTWQHNRNFDYIYFNTKTIDKPPFNTRNARRSVAVHELGHALGLCHKSENVLSIMWVHQPRTGALQSPSKVDKANYRKLWG
jgi:hypothetical protein